MCVNMFEPICIYTDVCVRFDEGAVSSQKRLQLHNIRASRPQACYTITSVGYGDITPKNVVERSVSSAARQGRSFAKKHVNVFWTKRENLMHAHA